MSLTNEIKEYALQLGFCRIGITTTQKFDGISSEAHSRGGYDFWLEKFEMGADPQRLFPHGKSVIVLAHDYSQCSFPQNLLPMIGRAYLARCYLPQPGSPVYQRLQLFEAFLQDKGLTFTADLNILLMRPAAERAGVACFGRNNFSYVDGIGSFVILYGYVVDKELEYDEPVTENRCPPGCRACINACPTKALYAPFKLDPSKCIGFNNWMYQGGRFGHVVPRELRSDLGCHIHGCDACQEACPLNKATLTRKYPEDERLERIAEEFTLVDLLHMPDGFYERCVQPIMYNYIKDKTYFQRNAAIAMGNSKNKDYIPHLIEELSNPHEAVRLHVAWALGEMDDETSKNALSKHMENERSQAVLEEIKLVLCSHL